MASNSALETLIELATAQTDEAAQRLGQAIRACEDTEQKLTMLLQYRDEYQARLQAGMAAGISPMSYRNFQLFLGKLDAAIAGQERMACDARQRMHDERSAWQASERKRMSYSTLATRAEQAQLHKESRRDQKLMDEFANRRAHAKQQ